MLEMKDFLQLPKAIMAQRFRPLRLQRCRNVVERESSFAGNISQPLSVELDECLAVLFVAEVLPVAFLRRVLAPERVFDSRRSELPNSATRRATSRSSAFSKSRSSIQLRCPGVAQMMPQRREASVFAPVLRQSR